MSEESTSFVCGLCSISKGNYTCPRCNIRYCSVACYQSQSHLECSEVFYHNCIRENLQAMDSGDDAKWKTVEMLQNFEEHLDESNSEENGVPDLAERVSGIDLDKNPEKVLDVLTPDEVKEFEAMLKDEKLRLNMVELWKPWWCEEKCLLLEEEAKTRSYLPSLLQKTETLDKLLQTKESSNNIAFDIINTLYGYALVARLYNGDHFSLPIESCSYFLSISLSLNQVQFSDVRTAISSCILHASNKNSMSIVSQELSIAVIEDVLNILKGPSTLSPMLYALAAVSDCANLFRNAYKQLKLERKTGKQIQVFFGVYKKLEFYFSWIKMYGSTSLQELLPVVELEFCLQLSTLKKMNVIKSKAQMLLEEQNMRMNKKLIEEL